jgi:hypothetical protein
LDNKFRPLRDGILPSANELLFDDEVDFSARSALEKEFKFHEKMIVFSIDQNHDLDKQHFLIKSNRIFWPHIDGNERRIFNESLKYLFPNLHFIVWDLDDNLELTDFSRLPKNSSDSGYSISKAIVRGINTMHAKMQSFDLANAQGEEKKAKEILPDWAHAFGGYIMTLKAFTIHETKMKLLAAEVDSAALANQALVRWGSMAEWRRRHPSTHLSKLIDKSKSKNDTQPGVNFVIANGMKHLLAKIALDSGRYATALRDQWFLDKSEDKIQKFKESAISLIVSGDVSIPSLERLFKAHQLRIIFPSPENLQHDLWPNELWITDSQTVGPFGMLLQFLIDEMIFNAFKNAEVINGKRKQTPILQIGYKSYPDDNIAVVTFANSKKCAAFKAIELNKPDTIRVSRGIELIRKLADIVSGSSIKYIAKKDDTTLISSLIVPILNRFEESEK